MRERTFCQTHRNIACADFVWWVRDYTYPPTFHYIADEQLSIDYVAVGVSFARGKRTHEFPEKAAIHRAELLRELGTMEQAVDLNRSGWPTNHLMIDPI